jgi:hypothetical protein
MGLWTVHLGRVGQLMVGPLFLSAMSRRCGTHGTKPRHELFREIAKDMMGSMADEMVAITLYD